MKYFLALFLFLLPLAEINAESNDSITHVFVKKSGKNNLYVLQLKENGSYNHTRYTDKKTYHDYGTYTIRHGKIVFKSDNKKRGFSSVGNKTLFINADGIYPTRIKACTHKKPVVETSTDSKYRNDWSNNPFMPTASNNTNGSNASIDSEIPKPDPNNYSYDKDFDPAAFVKSYYRSTTEKYAPAYTSIIDQHYCGPGCYFSVVNGKMVAWSGDTTTQPLFNNFETTIHETVHHVNGIYDCLIQPGLVIDMGRTDVFESSEFRAIVPAGGADKIFRYDTYVSEDSKVGANVCGIYGLMDEFSAYQNGCTASAIAAQTALDLGDKATAKKFLSQARGTYFAYYEFSLFIAWYLEYAEKQYPAMHAKFMANKNLRVAFTLNEVNFQNTIAKLAALDKKLENSEISEFDSKTGYGTFTKEELPKHESTLQSFRVKGVTTVNYKTFLNEKS